MAEDRAKPTSNSRVDPADLLTLLAVARLGKFTAAASSMNVNHTTVSRRIASLEKAVGLRVLTQSPDGWELTASGRQLIPSAEAIEEALAGAGSVAGVRTGDSVAGTVRIIAPEGFVLHFALESLAQVQKAHPLLQIEILSATQRASRYRSGVDIEVVVGRPDTPHSTLHMLRKYFLALYVAKDYAQPTPQEYRDIAQHRLVYYPQHSLGVDGLENAAEDLPQPAGFLTSNSITAQVTATQQGVGVGLLPNFAAEAPGTLVRVLPQFERRMTYWAAVRPEALRSPAVTEVLRALRDPHLTAKG